MLGDVSDDSFSFSFSHTNSKPEASEIVNTGPSPLHLPTQCTRPRSVTLYIEEHSSHHAFLHQEQEHLPSAMLEIAKLLPLASLAIAATSGNASETHQAKLITGSSGVQTLNASATGSIIILDYGHEVEGIPSFEVLDHQGDTSLFEISYAESLASFSQYMVCSAAKPDTP
jgi:hypothetical protein